MKPRKLIHGVGTNNAGYVIKKFETIGYVDGKRKRRQVWACPYYQTWKSMLSRCYYTKYQELYPTYKGCTVTDDWLTFSNFRAWMVGQDWEGKQLDKDILVKGNKVYSPDTCVFVTPIVNSFTNDQVAKRGEWLVGAYWHKRDGYFQAQCHNPFTTKNEYLGNFTCEQEAHNAWLNSKLELAHELAAIQTDPRVAEALINRYSNYTRTS